MMGTESNADMMGSLSGANSASAEGGAGGADSANAADSASTAGNADSAGSASASGGLAEDATCAEAATRAAGTLVSIVVPVYGVERYLDRCVASLVAQTHRDIEVILVDDGSPDGCPALCDAWAARDARIRVIHKPNGGLGSARNAGLREAKGVHVCFVDSDDVVDVDMVRAMLRAALDGDAQIVVCGTRNMRSIEDGGAAGNGAKESDATNAGTLVETGRNTMAAPVTASNAQVRALFGELMANSYGIPVWNKMYRRDFLEANGAVFDETVRVGEDTLFNAPLYQVVERLVCLPDPFYRYVSRAGSLCNRFDASWFDDRARLFRAVEPLMRRWGGDAAAVRPFANEFVYQTGVILGFLYEDRNPSTRNLRRAMIARIAADATLRKALEGFEPTSCRNVLTAAVLRTRRPAALALYGRAVAAAKRVKAAIR